NSAVIALSDPAEAKFLRDQQAPVQAADSAAVQSIVDYLAAKQAISLESRVAAAPSDRRQAAEALLEKLRQATADWDDAKTASARETVEIQFDRDKRALEELLPPIEPSKVKAEADLKKIVAEKKQDAIMAEEAFDRTVRAHKPAWFDSSWPTIKNLAEAL